MFNWKMLVTVVTLAPFLALFIGMGFLFYHIGATWDARSTDSLIAGLVATCGGGTVVIGVLLAIIIGVPFAIRILREAGHSDRAWHQLPPYPPSPLPPSSSHGRQPTWVQEPPRIEIKQGSWQKLDNAYDTWDDDAQPIATETDHWQ